MHRISRIALGSVVAAGLVAAPAQAATRVDTKLRAAERALDRAVAADDATTATSALATVRRNLAAAQKTALRKADERALSRVIRFEDEVVVQTVAAYDGVTDARVAALSATLDHALDARDAIVAATPDEDLRGQINADATDEAEDVADTLADDELTDEAKTALNAAATQLAATKTATASAADDTSDLAGDREDCPPGRGDREPVGFGGPRADRRS